MNESDTDSSRSLILFYAWLETKLGYKNSTPEMQLKCLL